VRSTEPIGNLNDGPPNGWEEEDGDGFEPDDPFEPDHDFDELED
jgi:hypothetical protein